MFVLRGITAVCVLGLSLAQLSSSRSTNESLYRLPTDIKPTKYFITLVPYMFENYFIYDGSCVIYFIVENNTKQIVLNSRDLLIDEINVQNDEGRLAVSHVKYDPAFDRVNIIMEKELTKQVCGKCNVKIKFKGRFNEDMRGFYRSSYQSGNETRWLSVTQFEPTSARQAFPCFDEPMFRATFSVKLARFEDQITLSNMPLINTTEPDDTIGGRCYDVYIETPPMPTYLLALHISDFTSMVSSNNTQFKVWARSSVLDQASYVAETGPTLLRLMGEYMNRLYKLPKMDVLAIPDFESGAMENWGLNTFREKYVLLDSVKSSKRDKQNVVTVVAHEFAHQWFGNLVTPQWWDYVWLNEAFATYFEYYIPSLVGDAFKLYPDWRLTDQFVVLEHLVALRADEGNAHPMTANVLKPNEIEEIFDDIIYAKGASVLRMLEHALTSEIFQKCLQKYMQLSEMFGGVVTPYNLWQVMDQVIKKSELELLPKDVSVEDIMSTWVNKSGYPVVSVVRHENGFKISQDRYTMAENKVVNQTWWIPVSYYFVGDTDNVTTQPSAWLPAGQTSMMIDNSNTAAIVLNTNTTGFYRVNYDKENWAELTKRMKTDHSSILTLNRAQLMDDSFNLARAGYIDYDVPLSMSQYLASEMDPIPWMAAANCFDFLIKRFHGTDISINLKTYLRNLIEPLYSKVAVNPTEANETHLATLTRVEAVKWACEWDYSRCLVMADNAVNTWMLNSSNVDPDTKYAVLCTALRYGHKCHWLSIWRMYQTSNVVSDRMVALKALACTTNTTLLTMNLEMLGKAKSPIRRQDVMTVFKAVASRPTGVDSALLFLIRNSHTLATSIGQKTVSKMFSSLGPYLYKKTQIEQLVEFLNATDATEGYSQRTVPLFSLDVVNLVCLGEMNLLWQMKHASAIRSWLNRPPPTTEAGTQSTTLSPSSSITTNAFIALILVAHFVVSHAL